MDGDDLTRFIFLRSLAFIYLIAFINIVNQFVPLVGKNGLVPARLFIERTSWKQFPSLFYWNHSDQAFKILGWTGTILSFLALFAIPDAYGTAPFLFVWILLWVLYQSFVNVGQDFYWFGWESMLLETGFLAIFLGPMDVQTPVIVLWLIRWVLFRNMFGAGLIKLRGAQCWKDLTCLYTYFETQPIPNPASWYFHYLPKSVLRGGILFNHFAELIVPWFYFMPQPVANIAGIITIVFQLTLIISGNLSFLNYLTIVQAIACLDGNILSYVFPITLPASHPMGSIGIICITLLVLLIAYLSINPIRNLLSKRQIMNTGFDPLHLVNTYGAFGSISQHRFEIILEGSNDLKEWKEYTFKAKPGDISKCPPIISPYHLRLDWLMWFAAMGSYHSYPWILNLAWKILKNDKPVLGLMKHNPFPEEPPKYVRALTYLYKFTLPKEKSKNWWKRTLVGEYLPVLSLESQGLKNTLTNIGWIDED